MVEAHPESDADWVATTQSYLTAQCSEPSEPNLFPISICEECGCHCLWGHHKEVLVYVEADRPQGQRADKGLGGQAGQDGHEAVANEDRLGEDAPKPVPAEIPLQY